MARSNRFVITYLAVAALISLTQSEVSPKMTGAMAVDSLSRFPHHVTIGKICNGNKWDWDYCAGSILNDQWILTSALCLLGSTQLELHFENLNYMSTNGSYLGVVNTDDVVHIYPTYQDDIALIKTPFRLIFSDTIKPVSISSSPVSQLNGRLAVMPGFDTQAQPIYTTSSPAWPSSTSSSTSTTENTTTTESTTGDDSTTEEVTYEYTSTAIDTTTAGEEQPDRIRLAFESEQPLQLSYGMFNILPNTSCKKANNEFDEFLQLCTETWANVAFPPCYQDYGSGLLVGWPAKSELVGIYSVVSEDCFNSNLIYTSVAKYASWIQSTINNG